MPNAIATKPKPLPVVIGTEKVICLCGHSAIFPLFPEKADKFREARRKKLTDRACTDCRQEAHKQREAEQRAKKALEPKKDKKKNPNAGLPPIGRLPDGSEFQAKYNAASKTWTGTLTIEGTPFSGTFPAIMKLLQGLDLKYREALALIQKLQAPKEAE